MTQEDLDKRAEKFKIMLELNIIQLEDLIQEVRQTYLDEKEDHQ